MGISHSKVDDEKEEWEDRLTHVGTAVVKKLRTDHAHHHDKTWNITQSAMVGSIQQTPPVMTFTDEAWSEKINTQKWPENPAPIVGAGRHWHSDAFVDTMFDLMGKTTKWCDVMSLSPPIEEGYFMYKMLEALHKIAETAKGNNKKPIVVRMMFGFGASYPNKYAVDCELWREKLTKAAGAHLSEDANIELWVGAWRYCDGWNHAKIIAVDGKYVHTGGHNFYSYTYLQKDPVHDLSIVLEGDVAHDGHLFANAQWEYVNYREATLWGKFLSMLPDWMPRLLVRATISEWPVGKAARFAPSYDRSITIDGDNKPPEGAVPVISVGRQGALVNGKPSDDALISMIDSSRKIIRMSLQSLAPMRVKDWLPDFYGWPTGIFQAMSRAMWDREVSIQIVLTNLGSKYTTDKLIEIIECEIFKCMKQMYSNVPTVTDKIIEIIEKKRLKISFIRHKGGKKYFREKKPDDDLPTVLSSVNEEDKKDHDEVCNHSKYIIIDDVCSYTGSQNLYVSNLAEWGVIVDDAKLTAKMLEDYWNPMWTASYDETDCDTNKVIDNVKNNFEDFGDATISTDEKAEDFLEAIMRDDAPRLQVKNL